MTTTGEIPILEPKEEEPKQTLSKEKLDSLKKAREERTRKVKAINSKELDIIHSLENIYNTLSTLDTRMNTLDSHVRKRHLEDQQRESESPVKKVRFETQEESDQDENQPMEVDEDGLWDTVKNGAALVTAFIVARFASDYINNWARTSSQDKDTHHFGDYSVYN